MQKISFFISEKIPQVPSSASLYNTQEVNRWLIDAELIQVIILIALCEKMK